MMEYKIHFGERVHYADTQVQFYGFVVKAGEELIDLMNNDGSIVKSLPIQRIRKLRNHKPKSNIRNCGFWADRPKNYLLFGELKKTLLSDLRKILFSAERFSKGQSLDLQDICKTNDIPFEALQCIFIHDKHFKKKVDEALILINYRLSTNENNWEGKVLTNKVQ